LRFYPRIWGLHRQWIYRIDLQKDYSPLTAIVSRNKRTIRLDWITAHWDQLGQFFASFAAGHTTASAALKRLRACGLRNHFYRAVGELGRMYETRFILEYLTEPTLWRRLRRGLLKLVGPRPRTSPPRRDVAWHGALDTSVVWIMATPWTPP
jgi:TnpA family transposase